MPLIIFRYLSRQLLQVMLAVTSIVLLIIMSGRFVNYLADAASGQLRADFLLSIMAWRIPDFLVMILPLGLFLGIILSYGRLYVDNEMSVLSACGMSRGQLLRMTLIPALGVALVVGILSLFIAPMGMKKVEMIFNQQDSLTEFDTLVSGRFQTVGGRVTYAEDLTNERQIMEQVFIASPDDRQRGSMSLLLAETAHIEAPKDKEGQRYLLLNQGKRFELIPGAASLRETGFDTYGIRMDEPRAKKEVSKEQSLPTSMLLQSGSPSHAAELQWRISLPLLIPVIVLLALPLAQVNPRQGRYAKLLPGILLYLMYLALLMSARGAVEDGRLSPGIGLWWVHGVFLMIALALYCFEPAQRFLTRRRAKNA